MTTLKLKQNVEFNFDAKKLKDRTGKTRFVKRGLGEVVHWDRVQKPRRCVRTAERPKVSYEDLFGVFKPYRRTVGENMLILREWLRRSGYWEPPLDFTITEFANAMQWGWRPRHAWLHFFDDGTDRSKLEKRRASAFLARWADKVLEGSI
jgi:hypothetical protein